MLGLGFRVRVVKLLQIEALLMIFCCNLCTLMDSGVCARGLLTNEDGLVCYIMKCNG